MGQYYKIVNEERKEVINFSLCKAGEIFLNEDDLGRLLLILYHDKTCINKGGGDLPLDKNNEFVGRWLNTSFIFIGDYSDTDIYEKSESYLDITKPLTKLVVEIFNYFNEGN